MDVLNTYGGEIDKVDVVFAVIFSLTAIFFFALAIAIKEGAVNIPALFFAAFAIILAAGAYEPVTHEVTLRPGYVIDATKYEIVEQRGQIYVIEEREANE